MTKPFGSSSWIFPLFLVAACGGGGSETKDTSIDLVGLRDTAVSPRDTRVADGGPPADARGDSMIVIGDPDAQGLTDAGTDTPILPDAPAVDAALPDANLAGDADPDALVPAPDALPADAGSLLTPDVALLPIPQLAALGVTSGSPSFAASLAITGVNFVTGTKGYFDGTVLATTVHSPTSLTVEITSNLTTQAGQHAIWVQNPAGGRSNTLYFTVVSSASAPEIVDYNPDNGVAGDEILILGRHLTGGGAITITGPGNVTATAGVTGTLSWLGQTLQTVKFTLPAGWTTGAISVTTPQGTSRGKVFNVGQNLARLAGVTLDASSEYSASWPKAKGADNNLATSWFSKNGDCATAASCTTVPWYSVTFPSPQTVGRIAMRGNREYASGYDYMQGTFAILAAGGAVLWSGTFALPEPTRDLDIVLPAPVTGASTVRFTSLQDESTEPGFAELEIF